MMKCTDILMKEHQHILSRMDVLQNDLENDFPQNVDVIQKHCEFIGKYADSFHHAKEEEIYFKWIIKRRPGLEFGPVHVMLSEHDIGRKFVSSAMEGIEAYKKGDENAVNTIKDGLTQFIELIREHIHKEDQILYKMAESINEESDDGDEVMLERFEEVSRKYSQELAHFL